jgi:transposase
MSCYTRQHKHYCGIDLHARTMSVCLLDPAGTILIHKNLPATPAAFLRLVAPYRDDLVVAVACSFTWYWLSALWARAGLALVLGHARSMQAIPGGKAKTATSDAHTSAVLLRGGMIPLASGSPPKMRAPRELLRRRCQLRHERAELLAHRQNTTGQYTPPELGKEVASKANRGGVAEHCPEPSVRKTIELDLTLIDHYDKLWGEGGRSSTRTAAGPDVQPFARVPSVPGSGKILALVIRSELHDLVRFPRVQDFVSYGRLTKGAKDSAGKRHGLAGKKIGHPQLQGACSAAAVLFLRQNEPGPGSYPKLERNHGKGKALTVLAQQLARAVDSMRTRHQAVDLQRFVTA